MDADVISFLKILGGAGGGLGIAWKWIGALREDVAFHRSEVTRWEAKYDGIVEQQHKLLSGLAEAVKDGGEE